MLQDMISATFVTGVSQVLKQRVRMHNRIETGMKNGVRRGQLIHQSVNQSMLQPQFRRQCPRGGGYKVPSSISPQKSCGKHELLLSIFIVFPPQFSMNFLLCSLHALEIISKDVVVA